MNISFVHELFLEGSIFAPIKLLIMVDLPDEVIPIINILTFKDKNLELYYYN